ncbi:hypothetical protein K466DRAFT_462464, partial [Polyporus arcularius HHB13444]
PVTARPPRYHPVTIFPQKCRYEDLLAQDPTTPYKFQLQAALQESEARDSAHKASLVDTQATVLFQGTYVDRVYEWWQGQVKKDGVHAKKCKMLADGLPQLLMQDEFVSHKAQQEATAQRKARKGERAVYQKAVAEWKKKEEAQKERNR